MKMDETMPRKKKTKTSREISFSVEKCWCYTNRTKDVKSVKNPEAAAGEKLRE